MNEEICEFCGWDETEDFNFGCCSMSGDDSGGLGWMCSREAGHGGPHVACGGDEHCLAAWEDDLNATSVPASMKMYILITFSEETGAPAKAEVMTEAHAMSIKLEKNQELVPLLDTWSAVAVPRPDSWSLDEQGAW